MPPGLSWVCQKLKRTIHPQNTPTKSVLWSISFFFLSSLRKRALLWSKPPEFCFQPHERIYYQFLSSILLILACCCGKELVTQSTEDEKRTENLSVHCIKWQNTHLYYARLSVQWRSASAFQIEKKMASLAEDFFD